MSVLDALTETEIQEYKLTLSFKHQEKHLI